jgi:hypothetical protein
MLNFAMNTGRYNDTRKLGNVMSIIRKQMPKSIREWESYYFSNVRSRDYVRRLAGQMATRYALPVTDCADYMRDVIIRRTYDGYVHEVMALAILKREVNPFIQFAPDEWDARYFIDFYFVDADGLYVGIQLKPESFVTGGYRHKVDFDARMDAVRKRYCARTFVVVYRVWPDGSVMLVSDLAQLKNIKAMGVK